MAEPSTVFATAADERYGYHALNLLGSLKANSAIFDLVVAFDLGLSAHQRELLDRVKGVEVRTVPAFAPHWAQGFTWKPWIWTNLPAGALVFWLDAGATILRGLGPALDQIRDRGYFVVSQGNPLRDIVPRNYYALYGLPAQLGEREYVAAGILGFCSGSQFYDEVIVPTFEDCLAGRSLGFSPEEARSLNTGLTATAKPILRDCPHFRWDQTVLNLRLFSAYPDPFVNDLSENAGWSSPRDHPQQLVWHHRRQGNMAYLARVPYTGRTALRGRAFGIVFRLRWWKRMHSKFLRPSSYVWKARSVVRSMRMRRT